jgi:hypothetical protein
MAACTPAITSSNRLEVVRLNRSISIFLVISNLFTHTGGELEQIQFLLGHVSV